MKVVIEIEIPDGQAIPDPRDIVHLTSPDWHCDWWHYSDVQSVAEDLTDDEAREVLAIMAKKSDCNVGINWDSIEAWADWVRDESDPITGYGFLCEGINDDGNLYGIELSTDKDGNEVYEVIWHDSIEKRNAFISTMKEDGINFPRENA